MKCPSCLKPLLARASACPECGFHLEELSIRFGTLPRHSIYVTDTTMERVMVLSKMKKLERMMVHFSKKFPQSRFSIVLTQLLPNFDIREYTFFLMNRCQFSPFANKGANNYSMLLLIDVTSANACLMTGYGLEEWISEEELLNILKQSKTDLLRGNYFSACKKSISESMLLLKKKCTEIEAIAKLTAA